MGDACCGTASTLDVETSEAEANRVEWRTIAAGIAAASWVTGAIAELSGGDAVATVAFAVAIAAGGATFAPSALLGLRRGRLGVGLLMTIAAIGRCMFSRISSTARPPALPLPPRPPLPPEPPSVPSCPVPVTPL